MPSPDVTPKVINWRGGELLHLRQDWQGQTPFACTLTVAGQDYSCHSAVAGQGTDCLPSGPFLRCASPKLPDGTIGDATLKVADAAGAELASVTLAVAPPFYPTTTYLLRSLCPSVWACGPRGLSEELR